jgi:hypothetical protein
MELYRHPPLRIHSGHEQVFKLIFISRQASDCVAVKWAFGLINGLQLLATRALCNCRCDLVPQDILYNLKM